MNDSKLFSSLLFGEFRYHYIAFNAFVNALLNVLSTLYKYVHATERKICNIFNNFFPLIQFNFTEITSISVGCNFNGESAVVLFYLSLSFSIHFYALSHETHFTLQLNTGYDAWSEEEGGEGEGEGEAELQLWKLQTTKQNEWKTNAFMIALKRSICYAYHSIGIVFVVVFFWFILRNYFFHGPWAKIQNVCVECERNKENFTFVFVCLVCFLFIHLLHNKIFLHVLFVYTGKKLNIMKIKY